MAAAEVTNSEIQARRTYFTFSDTKLRCHAMDYETKYRDIVDSSLNGGEDWLCDAQTANGIFPGSPEIGSRISFGANSQMENPKTCWKNYSRSDSHSRVMFTVQ